MIMLGNTPHTHKYYKVDFYLVKLTIINHEKLCVILAVPLGI